MTVELTICLALLKYTCKYFSKARKNDNGRYCGLYVYGP